ncbi:hypothetical protein [Rhizobium sp. CG4]|nr:hypothetical protein [Rhizobium sp. CG4]
MFDDSDAIYPRLHFAQGRAGSIATAIPSSSTATTWNGPTTDD